MADAPTAPAPPQPPQKPIRSTKWGVIVGACVIALFVLLDLATSIHFNASQQRTNTKQPQGVAASNSLRDFDAQTKQMTQDLERQRAALQAAIDKARGVDLSHLLHPLPECNQAMRDQLAGKYYITATSSGEPVRLACGEDNVWAVIPEAAASIEPPTAAQQQAMQRTPPNGTESPAQRRKQEAAKRREEALNSSSVALDFVNAKPTAAESKPVNDTLTSASNEGEKEEVEDAKPKYPWNDAVGPDYRVFEGSVIEGVLTNRLQGEFTGPVNVMVATDLYSRDHQHVLIPQGTRILGEATKVGTNQQRRLAVVFHRVIMPDGWSVDLDKFTGLDQQGASGLTGRVNTHWPKVIGTALLVGAIGGLSQGFGYTGGYSPSTVITTGVASQTGQQATQILDRALNVMPTITVYEGTRVRIWSARDFELPAYENHRVKADL